MVVEPSWLPPRRTCRAFSQLPRGIFMRYRFMACAVACLVLLSGVSRTAETPKDKEVIRSALQNFNDLIGDWSSQAESKTGKSEFWKEGMSWGWKFSKDSAPSLLVEFKDS